MNFARFCCALLAAVPLWADHNALLPRPQQVRYRSGALPAEGLQIRFEAPPLAEDRFVADRIAAGLARILGHPVTPGESPHAIRLVREGNLPAMPQRDEAPGPDSREAYRLRIAPDGAEIRARSSAGLFYGAETLLQLVEGEGSGAALPFVEITDWPGMAYRGVMMDLSHGPLPKVEEIERQIDFMARFKANQYYFYSELTVELEGYPLVNPGARYTQDEVRRIVAYARERHIDVVPCLEYYGHLHDLFRLERYADMAALPHSVEINPRNPKVVPMMRDWVGQMAKLFPSPWFHLGLDEPWELEHGAAAAGGGSPTQLFVEHLKTMVEAVRRHGKRVMFWAETSSGAGLFTRYPQLVAQLPRDIIGMPWEYDVMKTYDKTLGPLAKLNIPQVAASTVWGWQDIAPDFEKTFGNIDGLVADGRKYRILGLLNTNWADDAQVLFRATLPGMAYGAAAAWQTTAVDRAAFFGDYAARLYRPAAAPYMAAGLAALTRAQTEIGRAIGDHSWFRLWDDPLYPPRLEKLGARREGLRRARLEAETAEENFMRAQMLTGNDDTIPSLLVAAKLIDYAGLKFQHALEIADIFKQRLGGNPTGNDVSFWLFYQISSYDHGKCADLMDFIQGIKQEYRSAWQAEYGPYRMGTALGRFDAEYEYWRRLQANLWDFQGTFRKGDAVPPLDAFRPWGFRRP